MVFGDDNDDLTRAFHQRRRWRYHLLPRIPALDQDEVMRKIEGNNPTFTMLEVGSSDEGYNIPPGDDWDRFGRAIGNNTHLTEMSLHDSDRAIPIEFLRYFLHGCCLNRSIQKLSFSGWDLYNEDTLNILIRFFSDNRAFECLVVDDNCEREHGALAAALQRFVSLKEFKFTNDDNRWACLDNAIAALIGHSGLVKLTISNVQIESEGCAALAKLLQTPRSELKALHLLDARINDQWVNTFASGLSRNSTLKELEIRGAEEITEIGWQAIVAAIPKCEVKKLAISSGGNEVNDTVILSLSNSLLNNTTVKTLDLSENGSVTIAGWNVLFRRLRDSDSALVNLNLSFNSITDEGIDALTQVLVNNNRLRELNLRRNQDVTAAGWVALSIVLRYPSSALEKLDLSRNHINNTVMVSYADALSDNSKLRELELDLDTNSNSIITTESYAACAHILCDISSVLSTYHSNHSLEKLSNESNEEFLPQDLRSLLQLNRENIQSQAARIKIIATHFSGCEINMQPFMDMGLSVRPHAIAWMAREDDLYQFLRAMPSLLEKAERNDRRE
jgi:hypothetical protein